eukprot:maker-scaffold797_size95806-snap-gene-0.21 protein:Tk12327 transcript:maker-scaffold797_size95806-snap-gene-0.21-mRNA-1 annotation:"Carbamoyltransferase"
MRVLLFGLVAIIVIAHLVDKGKAKMMARGFGSRFSIKSSSKPWNNRGFSYGGATNDYDYYEEDDQAYFERTGKERPCVGLCYYEKLKYFREVANGEHPVVEVEESSGSGSGEIPEDDGIPVWRKWSRRRKVRPCIGLCHYMKVNGYDDTYVQGPYRHDWAKSSDTTEKPCVGLCYYFKSRGLEYPYKEAMDKK